MAIRPPDDAIIGEPTDFTGRRQGNIGEDVFGMFTGCRHLTRFKSIGPVARLAGLRRNSLKYPGQTRGVYRRRQLSLPGISRRVGIDRMEKLS